MSGKAQGYARTAEGVVGWFSATFRGYAAAVEWRDGQTAHEPEARDRWLIIDRLDRKWGVVRTWCLPPGDAEHAQADPGWTPEIPFELLPPATRWTLIDDAEAAGLPAPGRRPLVPRPSPSTDAVSPTATPKRRGRKSRPPADGS